MRTTGRLRALPLAACLAVVLGILAMHALNHEATMVEHPGTSMVGMVHDSPTPQLAPVAAALDVASGTGHSMDDMVMLCVAMLVGAAAGLLLALGLRRLASVRAVGPPRSPGAAVLSPQRLATGPPYVWEFSVVRC